MGPVVPLNEQLQQFQGSTPTPNTSANLSSAGTTPTSLSQDISLSDVDRGRSSSRRQSTSSPSSNCNLSPLLLTDQEIDSSNQPPTFDDVDKPRRRNIATSSERASSPLTIGLHSSNRNTTQQSTTSPLQTSSSASTPLPQFSTSSCLSYSDSPVIISNSPVDPSPLALLINSSEPSTAVLNSDSPSPPCLSSPSPLLTPRSPSANDLSLGAFAPVPLGEFNTALRGDVSSLDAIGLNSVDGLYSGESVEDSRRSMKSSLRSLPPMTSGPSTPRQDPTPLTAPVVSMTTTEHFHSKPLAQSVAAMQSLFQFPTTSQVTTTPKPEPRKAGLSISVHIFIFHFDCIGEIIKSN